MASSIGSIVSQTKVQGSYLNSTPPGTNGVYPLNRSRSTGTITNGTGANQANKLIDTPVATTIAGAGTYTIDVTSTVDPFGNAVALTRVTEILVIHDAASAASSVTVGGGTNPLVAAAPSTKAGGIAYHWRDYSATGLATSGSVKNLRVVNNDASNSATVKVVVIGSQ